MEAAWTAPVQTTGGESSIFHLGTVLKGLLWSVKLTTSTSDGKTGREAAEGYNSSDVVKYLCKEPRSYLIQSEEKIYRGDRRHILPVTEPAPPQEDAGLQYIDHYNAAEQSGNDAHTHTLSSP